MGKPFQWMDAHERRSPAKETEPGNVSPCARRPAVPFISGPKRGPDEGTLTPSVAGKWIPAPAKAGLRTLTLRVRGLYGRGLAEGDIIIVDPHRPAKHGASWWPDR